MTHKSEYFFLENGDATAIIAPEMLLSFTELAKQSQIVKNNLIERGLTSGQRIALLGPNSPEYVILLYGLWQAGMVAVPLSTRWPLKMIEESLHEIDSSHLIEIIPEKRGINLAGINTIDGFDLLRNEKKVENHVQNIKIKFDPDLDATIMFTSGSSSKPKAALHSFRNHFFSALGSAQNIPFKEGDCWLLSLPIYHIGGMAILFRALLGGGAVALPSLTQTLDETLKEHQVTHISLVATQLKQLLRERGNLPHLKSMKAILLGGGPIPVNLVELALKEKLPLFCSYGSTEMSSQITATSKDDSFSRLQTAGRILPHRDLVIAEDSEIRVRRDTLFRGYLKGSTVNSARDSNGWFHTGDLGRIDDRGYLTVTGRKDNMFISGGENIQPEEIESVMMQIEGVNQVMVVPIDHPKYGKRPVAFIKTRDTRRQDNKIQEDKVQEDKITRYKIQENKNTKYKIQITKLPDDKVKEVREYLEKRLPRFKIPDYFFPWPEERYLERGMKPDRRFFQEIAGTLASESRK